MERVLGREEAQVGGVRVTHQIVSKSIVPFAFQAGKLKSM